MFNKNTAPNLCAIALILLGLALPEPYKAVVMSTGLFALSGALTNWLAVHMLFERVPGLYGSGIVALHFEEFKTGIIDMVHEELLARESVERLMNSKGEQGGAIAVDLAPMLKAVDMDTAFDQLVTTINESSFGSMLAMVGGEAALQPLREPFKQRMSDFLLKAANSPKIQALVSAQVAKAASSETFINKLDHLLRARLDEMTPEMVKDIIQRMIKKHLGWLVIWGGVFGGLIGLTAGLARVFF